MKKEYAIINLQIDAYNLQDFEIILFDSFKNFGKPYTLSGREAGEKYWLNSGNLFYQISLNPQQNFVEISSSTINYRALIEALKVKKIHIKFIRITTNNQQQIVEPLKFLQHTIFGKEFQDFIIPNRPPTQVQTNIIDIAINKEINGEKGIAYKILGNNDDKTIFIDIICAEI